MSWKGARFGKITLGRVRELEAVTSMNRGKVEAMSEQVSAKGQAVDHSADSNDVVDT